VRVGQNPAKYIDKVDQPAKVTIALVNFIPLIGGYHEHSLDVLKASISSINSSTPHEYDLMVFDNHSCQEVKNYLLEAYESGQIQYLILSDKNIGKIGAWNYMFGAAQGEFVAFSDADILFRPGWLEASMKLFATYPKVGMVTARPLRTPMEFSTASLDWAEKRAGVTFQKGNFLDWDTYIEHVYSLGYTEEKAREEFDGGVDYRVQIGDAVAFLGAAHFQFLTRKEILDEIFPIPSEKPMRGERAFDIAINNKGLLRLGTDKPYVVHMGNSVPSEGTTSSPLKKKRTIFQKILYLPGIRHLLLGLDNWIFRMYFHNVD
jgi:glycosyltransferase involved in cell wall biosynthesis